MRILYRLSSTRWLGQRALTLSLALLALTGFFTSTGATYSAIAQSPSTLQGGGTTQPPKGTAQGERAYKPFTPKGKEEVRAENAENHGGTNHCENCGVQTVPAQQSKKG